MSSFRRQISLYGMLAVLLMGALSAVVSAWQGSAQVRATLERQGIGLAHNLAQQSQLALLTDGAENAREAMIRAFSYPDVERIELLHLDGRLLTSQGGEARIALGPPQNRDGLAYLEAETERAWSFIAPVLTIPDEASPFDSGSQQAQLLGYVRVLQGKATLEQLQRQLMLIVFGVGLGLALVLLWTLRRLAHGLTRPLGELAGVMSRAGAGELRLRAPLSGPQDIASMAQVFNAMMERIEQRELELQRKNVELARHAATLEERVAERTRSLSATNAELQGALASLQSAQKQLVESEKLASLGRLVAGIAHELNTPLGNALISATTLEDHQQQLLDAVNSGQVRKSSFQFLLGAGVEAASLVSRNVRRASEIVRGFKQLAIDQTTEMRRRFDADEVIDEVLTALKPMFKHTPYKLEADLAPGIAMDSFPGPLGQVVTNIVQNALLHGFDGRNHGLLRVRCQAPSAHSVELVFEDDGLGMDDEVRQHVFDAFFTTKLGQGGSGLGMQIVYTLVTGLLGGTIEIASQPGVGTRVCLNLPRIAPAQQAA